MLTILLLLILPIKIFIPRLSYLVLSFWTEHPHTTSIALGFSLLSLRTSFKLFLSEVSVTVQVFKIKISHFSFKLQKENPFLTKASFIKLLS